MLEENIKPRTDLPPLLVHLRERRPESLHYLGVSFGLTLDLFRFWRKHKFAPFYIGQIPVKILHFTFFGMAFGGISYCSNKSSPESVNQSAVTGEHTCMVLKPLNNEDIESSDLDQWGFFSPFYQGGSIILIITLTNPASFSFCRLMFYRPPTDFRERFRALLDTSFRSMEYKLAMRLEF